MTEITKKTVLSCTTHRGLHLRTLSSVQACPWLLVSLTQGVSDVALARCLQIDSAHKAAKKAGAEFVLFIDDDMEFSPQNAEDLLAESRRLNHAVSARYVIGADRPRIACSPMADGRFVTGLGFLAVPIAQLDRRMERAQIVKWGDREIPAVTSCGPVTMGGGGVWVSEDYEFTVGLGGVYLSEVAVGHLKTVALYPSQFQGLSVPSREGAPDN